MTENELYDIITSELDKTISDIQGGLGNVPKKTGNLRESIKVRIISPTNFQIYLDENQAPYGPKINEHVQFWNRIYHQVSYRLASALGQIGKKE